MTASIIESAYPPVSVPPTRERPLHVVLACSGSVASVKVPLMVGKLMEYENVQVQVISTASARSFFDLRYVQSLGTLDLEAKPPAEMPMGGLDPDLGMKQGRVKCWTDEDEWKTWTKVSDPILHIELRRWADIVLIAPCSANTLAKICAGICDNLLTCFLRALSPSTPTLLFPAMNTLMFEHPLTARHVEFVQEVLKYEVHGPIEKLLACGDVGNGAMLPWDDIIELVIGRFKLQQRPSSPSPV